MNPFTLNNQAFAEHMSDSFDAQSSFMPVGSGARALGMSGAFIGIADDATAASWNPGGLIDLQKPEISIVGTYAHWLENSAFDDAPQNDFNASVSKMDINYFSLVSPTFECFGRSMLLSINYQHLFNFSNESDFDYFQNIDNSTFYSVKHFVQKGKLYAIGIAGCIQINQRLSFGVTVNLWDDYLGNNGWNENKHTRVYEKVNQSLIVSQINFDNSYEFKGMNFNFGILYDITDALVLGAVIKTPFTAKLKHEVSYSGNRQYRSGRVIVFPPERSLLSEELDMPMSSGIGFGYEFSEYLTLAADIYRTEWQDCVLTNHEGSTLSFISSQKASESTVSPTHQIRFGFEYLKFNKQERFIIPIRGGIFYEQSPAEGSPDDFFGGSIGTGFSKEPYVFDIAFQYRRSRDCGESKIIAEGFSQELQEFMVYSSFIYHFSK
jgi:long-subunit fatty acid transport protein